MRLWQTPWILDSPQTAVLPYLKFQPRLLHSTDDHCTVVEVVDVLELDDVDEDELDVVDVLVCVDNDELELADDVV